MACSREGQEPTWEAGGCPQHAAGDEAVPQHSTERPPPEAGLACAPLVTQQPGLVPVLMVLPVPRTCSHMLRYISSLRPLMIHLQAASSREG